MSTDNKLIAAAVARLAKLKRQRSFVPNDPDSRPTAAQQELIEDFGRVRRQWVVAGNRAGKSMTCARIVAWMLEETHPTWTRPAEWGKDSLLIVVCARTGKHIEESLLPYLTSFLGEDDYKVVRLGNIAQRLEHKNGNRIVFQSLENPHTARERVQSYTAHCVWVDEQSNNTTIIAELLTRTNTTGGYFLASFTPLVYNPEVKAMVEGAQLPMGKKYKFKMFDNPKLSDPTRQAEILAEMSHLTEVERNARLYGDWITPTTKVYDYRPDDHRRELPDHYSPAWRHLRSVDPAISSKLGYILLGEDPRTGFWYTVKAKYLDSIKDPNQLFDAVEAEDKGYNIIRRVSDPHETWFISLAASKGRQHMCPYDKSNRKPELISGLQSALGSRLFITPWCIDLEDELLGAQWSESREGKIANGSKYHLTDALQYAIDLLPKSEIVKEVLPWEVELRKAHATRKRYEATRSKSLSRLPPARRWARARRPA